MTLLKVAADSPPLPTAGGIEKRVRAGQAVEVQAIGPDAVNQAVKALAAAARSLAGRGTPVAVVPRFVEVDIAGRTATALHFRVFGLAAPVEQPPAPQIRVAARSATAAVAGALAAELRRGGAADVSAIGAGAVHQAVKAIAAAAGFLHAEGRAVACVPALEQGEIEGRRVVAVRLRVWVVASDAVGVWTG